MRRKILYGRYIWNRVPSLNRPFCSTPHKNFNNKPATVSSNGNESSSSSSTSQYSEQYKALNNLDFMTAAKILFTDQPKKKKFGLDFHLVQLFFVCLPSLAVYLVAQYARSEMKKMDAELELKKQAEFEAQAKEMELKKAEEGAADPVLREVRERLNKLEEKVKDIVIESKKQLDDAQIEASKIQRGLEADKSSEVTTRTSTEGKTSEPVPSTPSPGSQHKSHG
ncbi:uncharacterized protein LOC111374814 isoform X1 [Olea europaea var. sylvestris]|uniref:Uncharacterized protein LOC111374814 isoform X1 n=1 Tax=Olea europaea subsp. europaea TaxID=158383 RepID=A0A8S0PHK3_OLEEU|nr:uncharacterized protein LOC111374814 isoform X1 [Olea europaea var. sylvestris]XP_022853320.1 uncharacterized protein LOC111374814 isoform X1 [Olea europaea var. sylvestris]CAA2952777.1 uncharacterized protein LOC111374814 isoform X1 [Olea europaea subsp. europaea]